MLQKFQSHIENDKLCNKHDTILLAISGGVDSMVMLDLFIKAEFNIEVAHINYKMRAIDSDDDEQLVKSFCIENNITFHSNEFPKELKEKGNFQEVARDYRYDWFQNLCYEFTITKIATAHHRDDVIETFFINLFRGSGLKGLASMQSIHGNIIRPMLPFSKDEIYKYAEVNNIKFREDSSNKSDVYLRNFIRNKLMTDIKSKSENYISGISQSINNINRSQEFITELIGGNYLNKLNETEWFIYYNSIENINDKTLLLYYLLKNFDFNIHQIENIINAELLSSKVENSEFEIIKDREGYFIRKKSALFVQSIIIEKDGVYDFNDKKIQIDTINTEEQGLNYSEPGIQYLGFETIPFPFILRKKQDGDTFKPFGLNGISQSIKKYFVDHKFSLSEKENSLIIEKNEIVLSLFPYRVSEDSRVKAGSTYVLKVREL